MPGREMFFQQTRRWTLRRPSVSGLVTVMLALVGPAALAQPAMMAPEVTQFAETEPRADRSQSSDGDLRPEQRLKQQGQEPNYRVEGVPQPDVNRADAEDKARREPGPGEIRQDTGIADPSVNPGQARRMQTIEGKILRQDEGRYVIAGPNGKETTLLVDADTTGDTAVQPGDHIAAKITPQGRAVTITKQAGQ